MSETNAAMWAGLSKLGICDGSALGVLEINFLASVFINQEQDQLLQAEGKAAQQGTTQ